MDKSQLKINNYFLISPVKKLKWSKPTDLQQRSLSAIRQCNNIAGWATVKSTRSVYLFQLSPRKSPFNNCISAKNALCVC